ncbi:MAG: hypothetical protein M1530_03365 [Candidatus Marsarchaeota archaeon]|nr:hypothetical protein [Candidatus Marsarchaeota archaeon]
MRLKLACLSSPSPPPSASGPAPRWQPWLSRIKADLFVFPECFLTGYDLASIPNVPDSEIKARLKALEAISRESGRSLLVGSPMRREGRLYNSLLLVKEGASRVVYEKSHLIGLSDLNEQAVFSSGSRPAPLQLSGVPVGLAICYDLRFPEHFGPLAASGAPLFIVPAAWPRKRLAHWEALLRARAIENQAFFVGVNHVSKAFGNKPLAFDPLGEPLKGTKSGPFTLFDLDLSYAGAWRKTLPVMSERSARYYQ